MRGPKGPRETSVHRVGLFPLPSFVPRSPRIHHREVWGFAHAGRLCVYNQRKQRGSSQRMTLRIVQAQREGSCMPKKKEDSSVKRRLQRTVKDFHAWDEWVV